MNLVIKFWIGIKIKNSLKQIEYIEDSNRMKNLAP